MHRVRYLSGSTGEAISLDGPDTHIGPGGELRSRKWSRTLGARTVRGLAISSREAKVEAVADISAADKLRRLADSDNYAGSPGTLEVDGEWVCRCFIVESDLAAAHPQAVELKLTVAIVGGFWWRERHHGFVSGMNESGLDFPFDFPFDFSFSSGSGTVEVESLLGAKPRITFYGPCSNPYVTIGGNRYEIDYNIVNGCSAVIDATGPTPTVMHYDQYGNGYSIFQYAVREGGSGGGSYAFERVPAGRSAVTWSGTFAWALDLRELETEPPWSG